MFAIAKTRPYRAFRNDVGSATVNINTAYIGMELIARGGGKPDDLKIAWTRPKNPQQEVDQARSMIHAAMLARVMDSVDAYLFGLANEEWLSIAPAQRNILRKAVTKPGGIAYSIVDRIAELNVDLSFDGHLCLALTACLVAWRNQAIHISRLDSGEIRLDDNHQGVLKKNKTILATLYGGFDPEEMLRHMRERGLPRRKEIVSLVAATQNLVREIDWRIIQRTVPDQQALKRRALVAIRDSLQNESAKAFNVLWSKSSKARLRKMVDILRQHGFSAIAGTSMPYMNRRLEILRNAGIEVSPVEVNLLPQDFLEEVAALSHEEFRRSVNFEASDRC